jgi:RNA polymerase sigma factor (sigma-70 family)
VEDSEAEVVTYIKPVFYFCVKRLNNRQDAEDLASEIMVHVLNGIKKYHIESLENWVWRIAHNRYARFINMKNKRNEILSDYDFSDIQDDYDFIDKIIIVEEYQQVFKFLHTLSCEYRNILVDYYIGELPVKQICQNYALSESTVKWRLNIGREKIKTRMREGKMDKVYKRINWDTFTCNGSMNPNMYLGRQAARAICEAAYEKPLSVEEISLKTGLPAMYIEDELPRLIGGDAIVKDGGKYAANFIVLRLCDRKVMKTKFTPLAADIAGYFTELFNDNEVKISKMDFYGSDFTMKRLGYIALPAVLRKRIGKIKDGLNIEDGPYPPRKDGGYGWFRVSEKETENESLDATDDATESGCNITGCEKDCIYYFWLGKYFCNNIYHNGGMQWLHANGIISKTEKGVIHPDALTDDDRVRLLRNNLILKDGSAFRLNFPVFNQAQYETFLSCFDKADAGIDNILTELIIDIHKSFKAFVPKRLDNQINQWVSGYVSNIICFVAEELIKRGILENPCKEKPLTNGVFCVLGEYVNV